MSWSLVVLPLHAVARDTVSSSAYASALAYAPAQAQAQAPALAQPPMLAPAQPLPRVVDVLRACHTAGCHGRAGFVVDGLDLGSLLPPCDNPARCALGDGGDDLGELSVHIAGQHRLAEVVLPDAVVDAVGLRTPSGAAALRAVCALTASAGPLFVCDDAGGPVSVVWPHDRYELIAPAWPW